MASVGLTFFHALFHLSFGLPWSLLGLVVSLFGTGFVYFGLLSMISLFWSPSFYSKFLRIFLYGLVTALPFINLLYYKGYRGFLEVSLISAMLLEPSFLATTLISQFHNMTYLFLFLGVIFLPGMFLEYFLREKGKVFGKGPFYLLKNKYYLISFFLLIGTQINWAIKYDLARLWIRILYVFLVFSLISGLCWLYQQKSRRAFLGFLSLISLFLVVLLSPKSHLRKIKLSYSTHFYFVLFDSLFQSNSSKKLYPDPSNERKIAGFKFKPEYNVLYIVVDSWRAANSLSTGSPFKEDQFLEPFYKKSFVFKRAYSPSNYTDTSIPSMFTGVGSERPPMEMAATPRLWDYFSVSGYETNYFMTGDYGWAKLDVFLKSFGLHHLWSAFLSHPGEGDLDYMDDDLTVQHFLNTLKGAKKPWFTMLHLDSAHYRYYQKTGYSPFQPCELYDTKDWPASLLECYKNSIHYVSYLMKKIMDKIDLEKTIVVLTSDHGEGFKEHGVYFHNQDIHSYSTHVPLIFHIPDSLKKSLGQEKMRNLWENTNKPVSVMDMVPTLLDLISIWAQKPMETKGLAGKSLWLEQKDRMVFSTGCYLEYRCFNRDIAFVTQDHYLIFAPGKVPIFQLYEASDLPQNNPLDSKEVLRKLILKAKETHPFARSIQEF